MVLCDYCFPGNYREIGYPLDLALAATHHENVLRKPSCGNNLGLARPAGFAVSPYRITT